MKRIFLFLIAGQAIALFSIQGQSVTTISPSEVKLREALRNSMLQVRAVQDELTALQAKQAESESEKLALKGQLETLNGKMDELVKKNSTDKEAAEKATAALQTQLTEKDAEIARLNVALQKWKEGYQLAVNVAQTKENERARLASENILLQRKVEDRESKNLALFKLGNEILTRYQKYSLGEALAAKEPFTGITRARLEELVQDYQDKLVDQRIKPGAGSAPFAGAPIKP